MHYELEVLIPLFLLEVFQEFYHDNLLLHLNVIMFFFKKYRHLSYVFHFENKIKALKFWLITLYI